MYKKLLTLALLTAFVAIPSFGNDTKTFSISTKSPEAARCYNQGVDLFGNLRIEEALLQWRAAVKADPTFAVGWAMIAANESSPAAAAQARDKARLLMPKASEGEQMLIRWVVSRGDSDMIAAIAAANDLVASYPTDKFILYFVGSWMPSLNQWDRAVALQEKALAVDPHYAPALNEEGYVYAHQRDFEKADLAMKRYVEAIPNEPNPQDSYAEILRLAGRYEDSLVHYKEALKILPTFYSSQEGLGDTYALMGDQAKARTEYAKCSNLADNLRVSILCRQMAAYSYIRENKLGEARAQIESFVAAMHKEGQTAFESEALIALALNEKSSESAFADLDRAVADLRADHAMPKADRDEYLARIMAHKVRIAALAGDVAGAKKALAEFESSGSNSTDPLIHASWKGANGAWLYSQKKYDEAITELQDDPDNPLSQMVLIKAYEATGNDVSAKDLINTLVTLRRLEIDLWMAQQALKS
jgi:tetratricopeptide (TPR) repeat protein